MANEVASKERKADERVDQIKKRPKLTFGETVVVKAGPEKAQRTFVVHREMLEQRGGWLDHLCEKAKWGQNTIHIPCHHDVAVVEAYLIWLYDRTLDFGVIEAFGEALPVDEDQYSHGTMDDGSLAMFRRATGLIKMHALGNHLDDDEFADFIMGVLSACKMAKHRNILPHLARKLIKIESSIFPYSAQDRDSMPARWLADVMSIELTASQLTAMLLNEGLSCNFVEAVMNSLVRLRDIATLGDGADAFKAANKRRYCLA